MKTGRILILGDSTLSSLGGCGDPAVDILARQNFSRPLNIINPSAVGFTAADAWVTLAEVHQKDPLEAVVVYLGNCDACSIGYSKPRVRSWDGGTKAYRADQKLKKNNPMAHRNPPFTYQKKGRSPKAPPRCVNPKDHGKFLGDMAAYCKEQGIHLVLINAVSKLDFPPLNNLGNFIFYRLSGIADRLRLTGSGPALGLVRAMKAERSGDVDNAAEMYQSLRKQRGEVALIASNNLAALLVGQGQVDQAKVILSEACGNKHPMRPMLDFHLAQLSLMQNDMSMALKYMALAHAGDYGSYRVNGQYRSQVAKAAQKHELALIDVDELLPDKLFYDYCHPGGEGHRLLAQELATTLAQTLLLTPGAHRPELVYLPLNPDRYMGLQDDFFVHFGLKRQDAGQPDQELLVQAHTVPYDEILTSRQALEPNSATRARRRILAHPLFGLPEVLQASSPMAACDRGRLPEFYFMRHLVPVLREMGPKTAELLGASAEICPRWERIESWWPSLASDLPDPDMNAVGQAIDPGKAVRRAKLLLRASLERGSVAHDKYRTISYWFFRESLIFGTVSHFSMYINRLELLAVMETALLIHHLHGTETFAKAGFPALLQGLEAVYMEHKKHLEPYAHRLYAMGEGAMDEYVRQLRALLDHPGLGDPAGE